MRAGRPWKLALAAALLALLAAGAVAGYIVHVERQSHNVLGSSTVEFVATEAPGSAPAPAIQELPWPTFGFDLERTHFAPGFDLRPPFRRLWTVAAGSLIEFPPVVAYGRLYFGTNKGRFLAVEARTGKIAWERHFDHCIAASPAIGRHVVYAALMGRQPCAENTQSFLVAMDARTGKDLWRFQAGVIESSPLLVDDILYFGSWDRRVYALDTRTHHLLWSFETGDKVKGGPAYKAGLIYIGSYDGHVYALDARTGAKRWSASAQPRLGTHGNFYATPAVAYGRVFIGGTDGTVYAFGARSGRLLWARNTGSFVYSSAAVWQRTVYVGSYNGRMYALDAATGDVRWTFDTGHPISGPPTVLAGVLYFSTCASCNSFQKPDPHARRTYAIDARTGKLVWQFPDGEFSSLVADRDRAYLTGYTHLYGLTPARPRASHATRP